MPTNEHSGICVPPHLPFTLSIDLEIKQRAKIGEAYLLSLAHLTTFDPTPSSKIIHSVLLSTCKKNIVALRSRLETCDVNQSHISKYPSYFFTIVENEERKRKMSLFCLENGEVFPASSSSSSSSKRAKTTIRHLPMEVLTLTGEFLLRSNVIAREYHDENGDEDEEEKKKKDNEVETAFFGVYL